MAKKLQYGMVGGGAGSFIGDVHRRAIDLDGKAELAAGCFSSDFSKTLQTGEQLNIDKDRLYKTFTEMAEKEAARSDGIKFVVIVTPNNLHYPVAKEFLKRGISVACDKPLTVEVEQAIELKDLAEKNNCLFAVTYTYTGHVMAKEARAIVKRGDIGDILVVVAEYPQSWLADTIEKEGQKQAAWRTDPAQSGKSNCVGDIGSHIENLVSYITGLKIKKLIANLDVIGEGRSLDNNAEIIVRYDNGASGTYWCSQVAIGFENALKVRIFGTLGSVEFEQENCNYLKVTKKGQPTQIYSRGNGYISEDAASFSRIPTGHPEGFFEAFANIYSAFVNALIKKLAGEKIDEKNFDYPNIDMGIEGVRFIAKSVESMQKGSVWVDMD
ncbi:MAG: Gfo/Idh/MocA family oxidoreductase [Actinobacteria bacterium]|nr:Gfo/Idh/MocA family oxidoreductase [Actinomycetota bacterium]